MADCSCKGDAVININEKTAVNDCKTANECMKSGGANDVTCKCVKRVYKSGDSEKLYDNLRGVSGSDDGVTKGKGSSNVEGFLDKVGMPPRCTTSTDEDDCRKKRCADRYDSSESSDSGVAVLSCTDCSGSSTASSDITDPGSPFSTASSHSEDSALQPTKMPPTQQTAHHPPWPWTAAAADSPPIKRLNTEKTGFPKRLKTTNDDDEEEDGENRLKQKVVESKKPPATLSSTIYHLNTSQIVNKNNSAQVLDSKAPSSNLLQVKNKKVGKNVSCKTQGKITEYFKTQMKVNSIKKDLSNATLKNPNLHNKYFTWRLKQSNNNSVCKIARSTNSNRNANVRSRKLQSVTVPRKILPAPSKVCDNNSTANLNGFTPTVTLTTLAIPPNLTYLHTKTPKPPDNYIVQQFTTLSDKINSAIPTIMSTPCINTVIHPLTPPITNFNCFKLNATVVPIVKLNTLPNINCSNINAIAAATPLSFDSGVPTVLPATPKGNEFNSQTTLCVSPSPKQSSTCAVVESETPVQCKRLEEPVPSPESPDSGVSTKEQLEVVVDQTELTDEPQKSPILSQPKTIRFPAKQQDSSEYKDSRSSLSADSTFCQWTECHAQFNTSGALLEHLQIKHVIAQTSQEQFECLWLGCKVHGRKSCSRTWLERHVLAHAGTKPFRCIFDGCGMRFNSQVALQRHVNGHFNADGTQNTSAKKSVDNGLLKPFRRNGKKLRFRRQPWSARMFDFFDNGIMEGLQHQLLALTNARTQGLGEAVPGDQVMLSSEIIARRVESDGKSRVLVRWHPPDILPDEWIRESEYTTTKAVPIKNLEPMAVNKLNPILFPFQTKHIVRHKQRRKPIKST